MAHLTRRNLFLLALLTLSWGINWPIMKYGVMTLPPLEFRALSMGGGVLTLFVALRLRGESLRVPRQEWATVVQLALPNMIVWHLLAIFAIKMLSSGRSAILAYTMPIWAVLWGLLLYRERIPKLAWTGVGCALAGAILLMSGEIGAMTGKPLGTIMMLTAAMSWGLGTQMLKRASFTMPLAALTFWMLMVSMPFILIAAPIVDAPWRWPSVGEWAAIIYNAVIVFAFCHIVWFGLARSLPPVMSSLSIMLIPVVGVFAGMAMLSESPHWQDYVAIALLLVSLATVLFAPRRQP